VDIVVVVVSALGRIDWVAIGVLLAGVVTAMTRTTNVRFAVPERAVTLQQPWLEKVKALGTVVVFRPKL
jgi:hypothetical protein